MKKVKYQAAYLEGTHFDRNLERKHKEAEAYQTAVPGLLVGHPLLRLNGWNPHPYDWRLIHKGSGYTIGPRFNTRKDALAEIERLNMGRFDWTLDRETLINDPEFYEMAKAWYICPEPVRV